MIDRDVLLSARSDNLCRLALALRIWEPERFDRNRLVTIIRERMRKADRELKRRVAKR